VHFSNTNEKKATIAMVDSGELLEPFVARNISESNMYRRGSVIVISSVEDSHSGLLETFQPRSQTHCIDDGEERILESDTQWGHRVDASQEESSEETLIEEDSKELPEQITKPTASRLEPFNSKSSASVVDYIWDSLPAVSWSKTPPPSMPKSEACVKLGDAALKWKAAVSSMKETEDFRRIQKDMRSTRVLTGGGAHAAMTQLLQQRRDAASSRSMTPPGTGRRKSNSFSGFPSKTLADLNSQDSMSSLQVNLSPFASDTAFD
jgi:hypothetical protein